MTERVQIWTKMSPQLLRVSLQTTPPTQRAALQPPLASPHACPSGRSPKPLPAASFHECQDGAFKVLQIKQEELSLFCV